MKKDESKIFIRGQVWYWEDPIYGNKTNHQQDLEIPQGEQAMRFSRYVVIVQNTDSINNNSVLVIPCTTKSGCRFNVPISILHLMKTNVSNVDVESIMSVNQKQLKRYICTLSETTMGKINDALLHVLFDSKTLDNIIGVDINDRREDDDEGEVKMSYMDEMNMNEFFTKYISVGSYTDCVSIKDLMDSYNKFVLGNDMKPIYDKTEFSKLLEYKNIGVISKTNDTVYGVRLRKSELGMTIDSMVRNHDNDVTYPPIEEMKKWDDNSIEIFRKMFNKMGDKYTAEYFGVKLKTVKKYMIQWRKRAWYHMSDDFYIMEISQYNVPTIVNEIISLMASAIGMKDDDFNKLTNEVVYRYINEIIQEIYPHGDEKFIETHKMIYVLNGDLEDNSKLKNLIDERNVKSFMKEYQKIYPYGGIDGEFIEEIIDSINSGYEEDSGDNETLINIKKTLLSVFGSKNN